jgi:hypothetical protein
MSQEHENSEPSLEAVYLVAVRMHEEGGGVLIYTLLLMDEDRRGGMDRPLTDPDGYIVWFKDPDEAARAMLVGDEAFARHFPAPSEVALVYDLQQIAWNVTEGVLDDGAVVLNGVNLILDLVEATGFPLPPAYQKTLFELADSLTFSSDLSILDDLRPSARGDAMDALCWCVGAVAIKSHFLAPARVGGAP